MPCRKSERQLLAKTSGWKKRTDIADAGILRALRRKGQWHGYIVKIEFRDRRPPLKRSV